MRASRTTLGGLQCVVAQATQDPPRLLVVLCHGFGATGEDLVSFAPELVHLRPELEPVRFVFPAAPLSLGWTGMGEGLAWWHIDFEQMESSRREGAAGLQRLHERTPEGLPQARRMLREALDVACRQANLPFSRVVLGGFSQGSMLSTDVALRLEEALAGLCILSGALICEPDWRRLAPSRAGLPVFQSHGTADPLLPFASAEALRDVLKGAGLGVELHAFGGGHAIPLEVIEALAEFLVKRLPATPSPG